MSKSKYTIKEFLGSRDIKQVIIPEIQRDYVWKKENVEKLLKSLIDDALEQSIVNSKAVEKELESLSPKIREIVERQKKSETVFSNIGFIYAYEDSHYKNIYFLIDGQQRLTTIFLLLLAVATKNNKIAEFKNSYFNDCIPKLDYKVRDSSHSFIIKFIDYLLDGKELSDIEDQHWFFSDFSRDRTIKSIIDNYDFIVKYISEKEISMEYIEDNIELWFFDIDKSSQGEELYLYMNSRGESSQPNENIKASLLEPLSEVDKNEWGSKWELWQDFFWKNRVGLNADPGYNEFLKWVKIITHISNVEKIDASKLRIYIKNLKEADKFSSKYLELKEVEKYFEALKVFVKIYKDKNWLSGSTSILDYVRLIPVLMYIRNRPFCSDLNIKRISRFFMNFSRNLDISKNPDISTIYVINLMNQFIKSESDDVVSLKEFSADKMYANILTDEEVFKLNLYENVPVGVSRKEVESVFWKTEDFKLCSGKIEFIVNCLGEKFDDSYINSFNLNLFKEYSEIFISNFENPTDSFRRALLVHGDYSVYDGNSPKLGAERYTFGCDTQSWKKIIEQHSLIIKLFLEDFHQIKTSSNKGVLQQIINNYLINEDGNESWIKEFINNKDIFTYCERKNICWIDSDYSNIYLMKKTQATTYKTLSDFA